MLKLLYIDPGTGSIVLQGLIAFFLGISFYYRKILIWLKGLFGKKVD